MDTDSSPHPTDQRLRAFVNGKLDAVSSNAVSNHLDGCPECLQRAARLSSDEFLDAFRHAPLPEAHRKARQTRRRASPVRNPDSDQPRAMAATLVDSPSTSGIPAELANHPDYEVLRELGRGQTGMVFLARNRIVGRKEVLKLIGDDTWPRPAHWSVSREKSAAVAMLQHPNVVTAYSALRLGAAWPSPWSTLTGWTSVAW